MSNLKKGDYVLATKYVDGDPCDHFCVGFYDSVLPKAGSNRHNIVDGNGNLFRHNGFRRVEIITRGEGEKLLALFPEIGDKPGRSVWWHLDCIRGVPNPYDPCERAND